MGQTPGERGTLFSGYQAFLTLHFLQIVEVKSKTGCCWVKRRPLLSVIAFIGKAFLSGLKMVIGLEPPT